MPPAAVSAVSCFSAAVAASFASGAAIPSRRTMIASVPLSITRTSPSAISNTSGRNVGGVPPTKLRRVRPGSTAGSSPNVSKPVNGRMPCAMSSACANTATCAACTRHPASTSSRTCSKSCKVGAVMLSRRSAKIPPSSMSVSATKSPVWAAAAAARNDS